MSDIAISVEQLSKQYMLGLEPIKRTLREALSDGARNLFKAGKSASEESFWALKDVSFEIKEGDRVGIIGRNGAGKSTLLKVLSRITEPSTGRVRMKGRVASLLEVGTGFHPELTGRENIYLNGAVLGMSRAEIKQRFDEIVAFSEVEKFLDTPVKRYSSGMYVRLAFAVAAHLEPEILIVDEVLAVGDAQFQEKCLGKMKEVSRTGERTILLVSHNMSLIQALCSRCIVLQKGSLIHDQDCSKAIEMYMERSSGVKQFDRPPSSNGKPTITNGHLAYQGNQSPSVKIALKIFTEGQRRCTLDLRLYDASGTPFAFGSLGTLDNKQMLNLIEGTNELAFSLPIDQLATGNYTISLDLTLPDAEYYDRVDDCLSFEVTRPPKVGHIRVLSQAWGYGNLEIPLHVIHHSKVPH
jgi:lipopolysaccharide transport system ATP-binding protein